MHYLIETDEHGIPATSLAYQVYRALKYDNWLNPGENTYKLTKDPTAEANLAVGTLQYTANFLGKTKGINAGSIPPLLQDYAPGGIVFREKFSTIRDVCDTVDKPIFCKPMYNIEKYKFVLELKPGESKLTDTVPDDMIWQATFKDNVEPLGEARILYMPTATNQIKLFPAITHWGQPNLEECYKFADKICGEKINTYHPNIYPPAGAIDILWMKDGTMRLMEISNFISLGIRGLPIKPAELLRMVFLGIDYEKRKL